MKLGVHQYVSGQGWDKPPDVSLDSPQTIVFVFSTPHVDKISNALAELKEGFPQSICMGCSSAGEIYKNEIFERTPIHQITIPISQSTDSLKVGKNISQHLKVEGLKAVFVLSDGLNVNGSALVEGMRESLPDGVVISGGLAGDGDHFEKTWVLDRFEVQHDVVSLVAFYGDYFCVGHGSKGGWDVMGIDREVTRSKDNVLFELDGQPALALHKEYLGDRAKDLPASGLLFPLAIQNDNKQDGDTVRTILAVDETQQSITFAGNIPQGSTVRLMHANFDRLIDGASSAAEKIVLSAHCDCDMLAVAISCVGRRLVLGQRSEEEVEATLDVLPVGTKQVGFYSYGEISPLSSGQCDLHNQTMTLTLFGEK